MRVFVTGATGAVGRYLVPELVAADHQVTATTRTPGKAASLREAGAEPVVLDGLDRDAVIAAVRSAAPEVIIHQMTALAAMRTPRRLDKDFAVTNELRTRGTDNLLAAAAAAGTRRVIAQSFTGWSFTHVADAASAAVAAVAHGAPGVYNIVDSEPAPVAEWLPYLARVAGAKPPLRVPTWAGRLLAGEFIVAWMTTARGSSNAKARKELGWEPRYASWREGFLGILPRPKAGDSN